MLDKYDTERIIDTYNDLYYRFSCQRDVIGATSTYSVDNKWKQSSGEFTSDFVKGDVEWLLENIKKELALVEQMQELVKDQEFNVDYRIAKMDRW